MAEFWLAVASGLVSGLILLIIQPWVIKLLRRQDRDRPTSEGGIEPEALQQTESSNALIEIYNKLAVGLLGVLGGVSLSLLFRGSTSITPESDWAFLFYIILVVATIGGGVGATLVDSVALRSTQSFFLRLVTAFIFGFVGGVLLLVASVLGILALGIYSDIVERRRSN